MTVRNSSMHANISTHHLRIYVRFDTHIDSILHFVSNLPSIHFTVRFDYVIL